MNVYDNGVVRPATPVEIARLEELRHQASQPTVPAEVTMRQARLALLDAGLLDMVDQAIAAIPDAIERRKAEIEWDYSATVQRYNGLVDAIGAGLGLSEEDKDNLFLLAASK